MIGIQNTIKDSVGTVWLRNFQDSGAYRSVARVARHKLLDGGTYFAHSGVTETDRDLTVECRLSPDEQVKVKTLYEAGAEIMATFWQGCYLALIADLEIQRDGLSTITFYFKEKIS